MTPVMPDVHERSGDPYDLFREPTAPVYHAMLKVSAKLQIPLREFQFTFARSSGPGGQNVNKVNSQAVLTWDIMNSPSLPAAVRERFCQRYHRRINKEGQLVMSSQRFRDQGRNVADCLTKLQDLLRSVEKPPTKRKPTRPSKGAIRRRLSDKKKQSQKKQNRKSVRPDE